MDIKISLFAAPQNQNYSLPQTLIFYIAKNPSSAKVYQKLIQTCKYFFAKNPILFFDWIKRNRRSQNWETFFNNFIILNLETIPFKLWLTKTLEVETWVIRNDVSLLLNKVYCCELINLSILNQNLSFNEYKKLTNSGKICKFRFENVTVKHENGFLVPVESILERLPNVSKCSYWFENPDEYNYTSETSKKLSELPSFKRLGTLSLFGVPEILDPIYFATFLAKNQGTVCIQFHSSVSEDFQLQFAIAINENFNNPRKEAICERISMEERFQSWVITRKH